MTIIDTIPIYDTPIWLFILCIAALAILLVSFLACSSDAASITAGISFIIFLVSFCLIITGICNTYSHDEYVVTLDESVPSSFFHDYQLIKEFQYSDAIQVRKREGVN